uniref:Uncharacterized protein n=1 Tax=Arundo donax TaxID=35708 RepID=A0A0A9CDR2_ARUDO
MRQGIPLTTTEVGYSLKRIYDRASEADFLLVSTRWLCDSRTHPAGISFAPVFLYCTAWYFFNPSSYAFHTASCAVSPPSCAFGTPFFAFGTPSFTSYFLRTSLVRDRRVLFITGPKDYSASPFAADSRRRRMRRHLVVVLLSMWTHSSAVHHRRSRH